MIAEDIMALYNLSDDDWDSLPESIQERLATVADKLAASRKQYAKAHDLAFAYARKLEKAKEALRKINDSDENSDLVTVAGKTLAELEKP